FKSFSVHGILTSQIDDNFNQAASWYITGCTFLSGKGSKSRGIFAFTESEYMMITDCYFRNVKTAIEAQGSANINVSDCVFLLCGDGTVSPVRNVIHVNAATGANKGKFKLIGCKVNH